MLQKTENKELPASDSSITAIPYTIPADLVEELEILSSKCIVTSCHIQAFLLENGTIDWQKHLRCGGQWELMIYQIENIGEPSDLLISTRSRLLHVRFDAGMQSQENGIVIRCQTLLAYGLNNALHLRMWSKGPTHHEHLNRMACLPL
jgi:hypothetical protein